MLTVSCIIYRGFLFTVVAKLLIDEFGLCDMPIKLVSFLRQMAFFTCCSAKCCFFFNQRNSIAKAPVHKMVVG